MTSDADLQKHVLSRAHAILQDGLYNPRDLPEDSYPHGVPPENFEHYDVFSALQASERVLLHYCLNEESHYYMGYSEPQKKVVPLIYCC
jgi:hypothetical protein